MRPEQDLIALARCLRAANSAEAAFRAVTDHAVEATRSCQATVRLIRPQTGDLLVTARTGSAMHVGGAGRFSIGADDSLLGWCFVNRRSVRVNDPATDERFVARRGQRWMPTGLLATPLFAGTRAIGVLSVARRDGAAYTDEDLETLEMIAELSAPHLQIERLAHLAETDPLTLLSNRHHLHARLPAELKVAERHGRPLSAVLLDLDHFGKVNKTYNLNVGDQVLAEVADRMREVARASDVLIRFGGEEFLILLPQTTATEALLLAERLREAIADHEAHTVLGPVTITGSFGVGAIPAGDDLRSLLTRLDRCLQRAKQDGRNKSVGEAELSMQPLRTWDDFFDCTVADWHPVTAPPDRPPDYASDSGSRYWNTGDGVYREADHWDYDIHGSDWLLDGAVHTEPATGYAPYAAFRGVEEAGA